MEPEPLVASEPLDEGGGAAQGDDPAGLDQRDPVAEPLGLVGVVGDEQDGDALRRAAPRRGAQLSRRAAGSRPVVSSSKTTSRGRPTRARAIDRRCFCPPDSLR